MLAYTTATRPAQAQADFDRPGGDYHSGLIPSGDPADCALECERDRRCRSWSFNYPTDVKDAAVCWLKSSVPARIHSVCCVSGVRGAGVVEPKNDKIETSIDRFGGDYRNFDMKGGSARTTSARPPAPPTIIAAPGPMPARATPARPRAAS